jgi:hypothetical protein
LEDESNEKKWVAKGRALLECEQGDHGLDAYVCEGWDEPNYISADHDHYPDNSCYECDSDNSDEESCVDEPCCPVYLEKFHKNKTSNAFLVL